MNLDDQILAYVADRVRDGATPSDRDIQLRFALKSTDDALAALNRLRAAGQISVENIGNRRVIYCGPAQRPANVINYAPPLSQDVPSANVTKGTLSIDHDFIQDVLHYLRDSPLAPSAFGFAALNNRRFVTERLHNPVTAETRRKVHAFMAENPHSKAGIECKVVAKSKATPTYKRGVQTTIDREFISEVEICIAHTGISIYEFGLRAVGDKMFIKRRLHSPMGDGVRARVRSYMQRTWSAGNVP